MQQEKTQKGDNNEAPQQRHVFNEMEVRAFAMAGGRHQSTTP
jgi:hypothetical protein